MMVRISFPFDETESADYVGAFETHPRMFVGEGLWIGKAHLKVLTVDHHPNGAIEYRLCDYDHGSKIVEENKEGIEACGYVYTPS